MTEFKDRLKMARKSAKMTQVQLAQAIDVTQSGISDLESGRNKISTKTAQIAQVLNVNPIWLATGQGEMVAPVRESQIDENDTQQMGFWDSETPLQDDEFEVSFYKDAEFLGGSGFEMDVYDDGRRKIRYAYTAARRAGANPNKVICTTLSGDSMEELILDGSMIAIDTSKKEVREGKIYAFRHGNMLRVKYLIPRPDGGLVIRSHNERYRDEVITGDELDNEHIEIIGWVWNWSSLVVW